jgi:hypothetical protein
VYDPRKDGNTELEGQQQALGPHACCRRRIRGRDDDDDDDDDGDEDDEDH